MAKNVEGSNTDAKGNVEGATPLGRPESEIVKCNVSFGTYNPLGSSEVLNVAYQNKSKLDFFSRANIAIEKTNFTGILPEKGPYVAIALRLESNIVDKQKSEENWLQRAQPGYGSSHQSEEAPIYSVKARIPELHAHLPIPKKFESGHGQESAYDQLDKSKSDSSDRTIVDMYPTFACKPGTPIPQPGSLIWVDFSDRFRANGICLGPLSDKSSPQTKKVYGKSSKPFDIGNQVDGQSLPTSKPKGQTNSPEPTANTQVAKKGIA